MVAIIFKLACASESTKATLNVSCDGFGLGEWDCAEKAAVWGPPHQGALVSDKATGHVALSDQTILYRLLSADAEGDGTKWSEGTFTGDFKWAKT